MFHSCELCQSARPTVSPSPATSKSTSPEAQNEFGQVAIDAVDQIAQGSGQRTVETAEERLGGRSKGLKNANRLGVGLDPLAQSLQIADRSLHRCGGTLRSRRARASAARRDNQAQAGPHPGCALLTLNRAVSASCATWSYDG